jgi:hypothetical protein
MTKEMGMFYDFTDKNGGWVFARNPLGRFVTTARNWTVLLARLEDLKEAA